MDNSGTAGTPDSQDKHGLSEIDASSADPKKAKKKKKKKKDGLGSSRGIETMFRTAYRTHLDLTSLADTKANIMISINGLILSIIIASIAPKIDSNTWLLVPTTVVLISCLVAIIFAVLAARPRVNSSVIDLDEIKSNRTNILFFGNYTSLEEEEFLEGMTVLLNDNDKLYINMMRDIYGMGQVLTKKFHFLSRSYSFFMYGITISVISFIIIFIITARYPGSLGI